MKIESFTFYKPLHNEDAEPFFYKDEDSGLLVVADGLGGSGSTVHRLAAERYKTIDADLRAAFLPELAEWDAPKKGESEQDAEKPTWLEQYKKWVDKMLEPMIDDNPDTSALWASRIVIARYVYYVLSHDNKRMVDPNTIEEVENFINDGLCETKRTFDLRAGTITGQMVLPTTLVSLQYYWSEGDDLVKYNVLWAGDSRAYALMPDKGLRQLSKDHEDSSGAINKLFGFKANDDEPHLPQSSITIGKFDSPCAFFVCSDGLFDPFSPIDNLGVEKAFLQALETATTFDEYRDNLYKFYEPIEQDDRSIAFVALGFASFEAFKQAFISRKDEVFELYDKYQRYKNYFPVVIGGEEDPTVVIRNRANLRKAEILQMVAEATIADINDKGNDPIVSEELRQLYRQSCEEGKKKAVERKEKEVVANIKNAVKRDEPIFDSMPDVSAWQGVVVARNAWEAAKSEAHNATEAAKEAKRNLEKATTKLNTEIEDLIKVEEKKKEALKRQKEESEAHQKAYERVLAVLKTQELHKAESAWTGREDVKSRTEQITPLKELIKQYEKRAKYYCDNVKSLEKSITSEEKVSKLRGLQSCLTNYDEPVKTNYAEIQDGVCQVNELRSKKGIADKKALEASNDVQSKKAAFDAVVEGLSDEAVLAIVRQPTRYLTPACVQEWNLPVCVSDVSASIEEFIEVLNSYYADDAKYVGLIDAFIALSVPSMVDKWFNPSKLRICRSFASIDKAEVRAVWSKVQQMLEDYDEYLTNTMCI